MTTVIDRFAGEHAFLSNFHPSPLTPAWPSSVVAPTAEHAFQAQKTVCYEDALAVLAAPTPGEAKRLGRAVRLRADWEAAKLGVMRDVLALKFAPGSELAQRLLATGDALLVEGNAWGDRFWGVDLRVGPAGDGLNWLGHLLLARRAELRAGGGGGAT